MKFLSLIVTLMAGVWSLAYAGGSVEWEFHAVPLLKNHQDLWMIIEKTLDVSPVGNGVRLGKDFGKEQGKRIPPFEFPARLKGASGPYNLILVIHDPSGVTSDDQKDQDTWIEIRPKHP